MILVFLHDCNVNTIVNSASIIYNVHNVHQQDIISPVLKIVYVKMDYIMLIYNYNVYHVIHYVSHALIILFV
jgi:hypothetical protein